MARKPSAKEIQKIMDQKMNEMLTACAAEKAVIIDELHRIKKKHKRDDIWFYIKVVGGVITFILFLMGWINLEHLNGSLRVLMGF